MLSAMVFLGFGFCSNGVDLVLVLGVGSWFWFLKVFVFFWLFVFFLLHLSFGLLQKKKPG